MQEQDKNLFTEVTIDDTAKKNIAGIASWAMIIVVCAVIGYVLSLIGVFTRGTETVVQNGGMFSKISLGGGDDIGSVIFTIIVGLVINYFLYRFATLAKSSLTSQSQEELGNSFRNLKIYFAITTVIMILGLLMVLVAVAAIL